MTNERETQNPMLRLVGAEFMPAEHYQAALTTYQDSLRKTCKREICLHNRRFLDGFSQFSPMTVGTRS